MKHCKVEPGSVAVLLIFKMKRAELKKLSSPDKKLWTVDKLKPIYLRNVHTSIKKNKQI